MLPSSWLVCTLQCHDACHKKFWQLQQPSDAFLYVKVVVLHTQDCRHLVRSEHKQLILLHGTLVLTVWLSVT